MRAGRGHLAGGCGPGRGRRWGSGMEQAPPAGRVWNLSSSGRQRLPGDLRPLTTGPPLRTPGRPFARGLAAEPRAIACETDGRSDTCAAPECPMRLALPAGALPLRQQRPRPALSPPTHAARAEACSAPRRLPTPLLQPRCPGTAPPAPHPPRASCKAAQNAPLPTRGSAPAQPLFPLCSLPSCTGCSEPLQLSLLNSGARRPTVHTGLSAALPATGRVLTTENRVPQRKPRRRRWPQAASAPETPSPLSQQPRVRRGGKGPGAAARASLLLCVFISTRTHKLPSIGHTPSRLGPPCPLNSPSYYVGGCAPSIWKFPGQGLNPSCSCDPSHWRDKAGSLTHTPQRELLNSAS